MGPTRGQLSTRRQRTSSRAIDAVAARGGSDFAATHRVPALTGLRAAAAFGVCVTHAAFLSGDFHPNLVGAVYARLEAAVPVFFALSAFLLVRPWLAGPVDLRRYAWGRVWRILPAYWAVVLGVYAMYQLIPDGSESGHGFGGLLRNLFLVHLYGTGHVHTGLTQTWSLGVEAAFYLLLPLIGLALARAGRTRWTVPVAMTAISAGWIVLVTATEVFGKTARTWPPSYAVVFAAGIVVALSIDRIPRTRTCARLLLLVAAVAFAVTLTPLCGPLDLSLPSPGAALLKFGLQAVVAGAVVAAAAVGPGRILGWRPIVWLGSISYEFFLLHVVVMELVFSHALGYSLFRGQTWPTVALTTVITVPLAWLLHWAVDKVRLSVESGRRSRRSTRAAGPPSPPTADRAGPQGSAPPTRVRSTPQPARHRPTATQR